MTEEVSFEILVDDHPENQKTLLCSTCSEKPRMKGQSLITLQELSDDCPRFDLSSINYGQYWINTIQPLELCRICSGQVNHHECMIDSKMRNFKAYMCCPKCHVKIEGLQSHSPYTYVSGQWFRCPLCEYNLCRGCFQSMSAFGTGQQIYYCRPCRAKYESCIGKVWRWYQMNSCIDLLLAHAIIFLIIYLLLSLILQLTQDLVIYRWFYGLWTALYDVVYMPMQIVIYSILMVLNALAIIFLLVLIVFKLAQLVEKCVNV